MMDMLSIAMALTLSGIAALLTTTTALTPPDEMSNGTAVITGGNCHLQLRPGLAPESGAAMHPTGRGDGVPPPSACQHGPSSTMR